MPGGVILCFAPLPQHAKSAARGKALSPICKRRGSRAAARGGFAAAPAEKSYLADYRRCSLVLGRRVRYFRGDSAFDALATGIDDHGGLMVTFDDGTSEVLRSGEITLRLQDASS